MEGCFLHQSFLSEFLTMMSFLVVGGPGSRRGEHSTQLVEKFPGLVHISVSSTLRSEAADRNESDPLWAKVRDLILAGQMAPLVSAVKIWKYPQLSGNSAKSVWPVTTFYYGERVRISLCMISEESKVRFLESWKLLLSGCECEVTSSANGRRHCLCPHYSSHSCLGENAFSFVLIQRKNPNVSMIFII